jgi:hypothetical protein
MTGIIAGTVGLKCKMYGLERMCVCVCVCACVNVVCGVCVYVCVECVFVCVWCVFVCGVTVWFVCVCVCVCECVVCLVIYTYAITLVTQRIGERIVPPISAIFLSRTQHAARR